MAVKRDITSLDCNSISNNCGKNVPGCTMARISYR